MIEISEVILIECPDCKRNILDNENLLEKSKQVIKYK